MRDALSKKKSEQIFKGVLSFLGMEKMAGTWDTNIGDKAEMADESF